MNNSFTIHRCVATVAGMHRHQSGFSLHDLVVASAVASILTLGAVATAGMLQDARMTASVNQLLGDLSLARSEAIKRNTNIALCKSADGVRCTREGPWQNGWIVFADEDNNHEINESETVLRVQQALDGNLKLRYGETGTYYYVRYNSSGEAWPGATFSFCDQRGVGKAKAIIVYWSGRPRVSVKTSEGKALSCI